VLILNEDSGRLGRDIEKGLEKLDWVRLVRGRELESGVDPDRSVVDGRFPAAVHVPQGASDAIMKVARKSRNLPAMPAVRIRLICDPALPEKILASLKGNVMPMAQKAVVEIMTPEMIKIATLAAPDEVAERAQKTVKVKMKLTEKVLEVVDTVPEGLKVRKRPNASQHNVPAYTIFGIFFIALVLALNLVNDRTVGTFQRAIVSPVSGQVLLLGKIIPFFLINVVQAAIMLGMGLVVLPELGAPPFSLGHCIHGVILVTVMTSVSALGSGVFLGTLGLRAEPTLLVTAIGLIMTASLGGLLVPAHIMPQAMRTAGLITPHAWALQAYHDLILRGKPFSSALLPCAVLLGFGTVFYMIGSLRMKKALSR
jgi:ABC-2 type transport system permease protein